MHVFRKTDLIVRSLVINFLLVPIAALILTQKLALPKSTTFTLLLASASPGAPFAPKLVAIAGGDMASAIGLTVILAFLGAIATPSFVYLTYSSGEDALTSVFPIILNLVFFQLFPLSIGLVIRHWNPLLAKYLLHPLQILSDILFVALLVLVLSEKIDVLFSIGWLSLIAMIIFNVVTLVCGWGLGGSEARSKKALALTTASRNLGVVLLLAVESFPKTNIELTVVAFGLIEVGLTLSFALYLRWFASFK